MSSGDIWTGEPFYIEPSEYLLPLPTSEQMHKLMVGSTITLYAGRLGDTAKLLATFHVFDSGIYREVDVQREV